MGVLDTAAGALEQRTLRAVFVPVLGFLTALGALVVTGAGWSATVRWWTALDGSARLALAGALLVAALLLSQLLTARRTALIRLLEGYGHGLPRAFTENGRRRQAAIHRGLRIEDPRWHLYPRDSRLLLPTTFGNVLRGAEQHSTDRYSIRAAVAWPRLYPTLPEAFRQTLATALGELELAVTMCALGVAFALAGSGIAAWLLPWYAVALCWWGGFLVAWLAYRAAIGAAEAYGRLLRTAFDVYRWSLVEAMGLARPGHHEDEPALWQALDRLWVRGAVHSDESALLDRGEPGAGPPPSPRPSRQPDRAEPAHDAPEEASTGASSTGASSRRRRWPLAVAALGLLLSGVTAAAQTWPEPTTAQRSVPAYRPLAPADLHGDRAREVVGRYPLRRLAAGQAIATDLLGPRLADGALDGRTVLPVRLAEGRLLADTVRRGDRVTVIGSAGTTVPDVLVLDFRGDAVIVAVVRARAADLLTGAGPLHALPG